MPGELTSGRTFGEAKIALAGIKRDWLNNDGVGPRRPQVHLSGSFKVSVLE